MDATYTQQNTLPEKDVILTHAFFNGVKDLADDFELPDLDYFEFCCLLSRSNSLAVRALEGVECRQETEMEAARSVAIFVAIFAGLFVAFFCAFISAFDLSGERRKAARDKRLAEHKMAARLLRLNI